MSSSCIFHSSFYLCCFRRSFLLLSESVLFLDNLRKTKLSQGKPPVDFGDVYQSASRTPQSTTQAGTIRLDCRLKTQVRLWYVVVLYNHVALHSIAFLLLVNEMMI